jgi:hypothetical protein
MNMVKRYEGWWMPNPHGEGVVQVLSPVVLASDYDALDAEMRLAQSARDYANNLLDKERPRNAVIQEALCKIIMEGKAYAGHNQLEHCAQAMYDIAEAAIKEAEMITNKRLEWLSGRDYAASEAGQVAAELLTARARIAALESENAILRVAAGPLVVAALETKGEGQ